MDITYGYCQTLSRTGFIIGMFFGSVLTLLIMKYIRNRKTLNNEGD